ncbi:hypothetical protein ACFLTP_09530 [Chloroflexota bacterium]
MTQEASFYLNPFSSLFIDLLSDSWAKAMAKREAYDLTKAFHREEYGCSQSLSPYETG